MDPARVDVVLVRPARAANVAAACRAMKNMGVHALWLVDVKPGFVTGEARALAYGAWDVLDAARHVPDLGAAVAEAAFVAGTSGRPEAGEWTAHALAAQAARLSGDGRLAIVFGPEAAGLRKDELALCHARVRIPADPEHPSLNLAQAVLLITYELRMAAAAAPGDSPSRAPAGELEAALQELREGLLAIGYLNPENPEPILTELRRLLARAAPTPREVSLLRGLARQVRWAAGRIAGRAEPDS